MPNLNAHAFEARGPGDPYCLQCNLPASNRLHQAGTRRTRAVLVLDVPVDLSDGDVKERLLLALEVEPKVIVQDLQVIL